MPRIEFEILNHGCDGEQYFPGCGVAFTHWQNVCTGIGTSAMEAGEDALEQMACGTDLDPADLLALESAVHELSADESWDHEDPEISDEWHHYVSIRWRAV